MEREGILTKVRIKMDEATPPGVELPFDDLIGPILDECAKEVAEASPLHLLSPTQLVILETTTSEVDTNVAMIGTVLDHNFVGGEIVTLSGMGDAIFNGTFTVTGLISPKMFSFAVTHADIAESAESAGSVTLGEYTLARIYENDLCYIKVPPTFLRLYEVKFPLWAVPVRETTKPDSIAGKIQDNPYLKSGVGRPSVVIKDAYPTGGAAGKYFVCGKAAVDEVPLFLFITIPTPEQLPDLLIDSLTWLAAAKVLQISGRGDLAQGLMQQYGLSLTSLAKA